MPLKKFDHVPRKDMPGLLGISLRTFIDLESKGIVTPAVRGRSHRSGQYDVRATIRAYLAHREKESPRDRLFRLQADKVELDVKVRAGELLEASSVDQEWATIALSVKRAVLAIPARLLQLGLISLDQLGAATEVCHDTLRHLGKASS